ncbi:hypothetical protein N752_20290 [Desulforamulus aquiferis]|nr:hypothetical protein N752_20290 [Desulforamulus aquiferis]
MSIKDTVSSAFSKWMEASGPDCDVVISSRVRLARNIAEFAFPHLLGHEEADKVVYAVQSVVSSQGFKEQGDMELSRMTELSPTERQILMEKHLISPDLLKNPEKKAVVLRMMKWSVLW